MEPPRPVPTPPRPSTGGRWTTTALPPPVGEADGGGGEPVRHRLYVHLAWTTLARLPLVGPRQALALEGQLIALCRRLDVEPLEAAVDADAVHLLLRLKPVHTVATVARRLKRGSIEAALRRKEAVRWGRGWAAASVTPGDVRRTRRLMRARSLPARQLTPGLQGP